MRMTYMQGSVMNKQLKVSTQALGQAKTAGEYLQVLNDGTKEVKAYVENHLADFIRIA
jgi:hypothetical protein